MGGGSVDLSGKLVLVTGATRGIGRAVAIAAAAAGAELIITGRTVGALEEADDAIRAAGGVGARDRVELASPGGACMRQLRAIVLSPSFGNFIIFCIIASSAAL
ncbi:MAG: SDR family NAD(P)-dependent oxidoreductase, partial [Candidatus Puniceispirillaceae bacterium]